MKEQFLRHIEQSGLCKQSDRILLAVSGGLDSMVMLHLFHSTGFKPAIAHVNFKLRATESDGDELLVKQVGEQLNLSVNTTSFDTLAYAKENSVSVQVAARELRYLWFDKLMEKEHYTHLATAHHLNDNIETVLMNFVRGTRLKGIPEKNNKIIRPLLSFSRRQLEEYASENSIRYRTDSSNATDAYARNFVRHHITPLMQQLNSNFEEGFKRTLERLESSAELAGERLKQIKKQFLSHEGSRVVIQKSFGAETKFPAEILFEIIKDYGFNYDQSSDIVRALDATSGKRFLSEGYQLVVDRDTLQITPHEKFWDDVAIKAGDQDVKMGPWQMTIEEPMMIHVEADPFVAWLDLDRITFPLTWRLWKDGDYFYPLGMEHKKKVSDFLIDRKLSLGDKSFVTVLESQGQIVWIPGYRIDNRYKITSGSRKALRLTLTQYFV
jgi:tRNA(Ile)-lysidine synthase